MKILFFVNHATFFVSHRIALAEAAINEGYEVKLLTGQAASPTMELDACNELMRVGIGHKRVAFRASRMNPILEFFGLLAAIIVVIRYKPSVMHCVSPKGIIYGGIIARLLRVPSLVLAVSGMGLIFTGNQDSQKTIYRVVRIGYTIVLGWILRHKNLKVIVQNEDDKTFLVKNYAFDTAKIELICGSGINLEKFIHYPLSKKDKIAIFPARLLIAKGVMEFIEAANRVRIVYPEWRFILVGSADYESPGIIPPGVLDKAIDNGWVEWVGHVKDIAPIFGGASIVCLPSYREGMPKALLEAAASGCSIITTDAIGCRESIVPGTTGDLIPIRDSQALTNCILKLISDPVRMRNYGLSGRKRAVENFGVDKVVLKTLKIYRELLSHGR